MAKLNGKMVGKALVGGGITVLVAGMLAETVAGFGSFMAQPLFSGLTAGGVVAAGVGYYLAGMANEKLF